MSWISLGRLPRRGALDSSQLRCTRVDLAGGPGARWTDDESHRAREPLGREGVRTSLTREDEHDNRLILRDEQGVIPVDGQYKAVLQRQQMASQSPIAADAGVTRASWTSLGPTNLSGRIRTVVIHPTRMDHMLLGAATGGVWKSTDAGAMWRPVDEFLPAMAIRTLAINPMNPEQVYAGTGEVVQGVGLLRSEDFGETWQHLAGSQNMGTVYRIRITPNGSTLYAATETGVYRVTNNGTTFDRIHGGAADDIEFDPSDPRRVIVSAWLDGRKVIMRLGDGGWTVSTGVPTEAGFYEFINWRTRRRIPASSMR